MSFPHQDSYGPRASFDGPYPKPTRIQQTILSATLCMLIVGVLIVAFEAMMLIYDLLVWIGEAIQ